MNREIQDLLQKIQDVTNTAVKKLQEDDKISAAFFFNLSASFNAELSRLLKEEK